MQVCMAGPGCSLEHWNPRDLFLESLVQQVPNILAGQDEQGRFGTEPWICQDQNLIFPLAAAWSFQDENNPLYRDEKLLDAIVAGGDVLIREADEKGMWTFRKKDHSTWGQIFMPWTYSRWIRAFFMIRDFMPEGKREAWEQALSKGYEGISRTCLGTVHNIPAHHAMGLYFAGMALEREDWRIQARDFMRRVMAVQHTDGYWSEHHGPVVAYNFVYTDSLGTYFSVSQDPEALEALRKAALFHASFTYPDGSSVETIDERNPYSRSISLGNVGFTHTPEGRGYLLRQLELHQAQGGTLSADFCASMLLYGQQGTAIQPPGAKERSRLVLGEGDALVLRQAPWFLCLSTFTCEPPSSRWIQDRQNYLSLYHDDLGMFLGGGNTKLQPLWSTFTKGDVALLRHEPGDENPEFFPAIDLIWCAQEARIEEQGDSYGLVLKYGEVSCRAALRFEDEKRASLSLSSGKKPGVRVEAHLPFMRGLGSVQSWSGDQAELEETSFEWNSEQAGGGFRYGKLSVSMPEGTRLCWPVLPHNPYKKDGASDHRSGRLVLAVPLSEKEENQVVVSLTVE